MLIRDTGLCSAVTGAREFPVDDREPPEGVKDRAVGLDWEGEGGTGPLRADDVIVARKSTNSRVATLASHEH